MVLRLRNSVSRTCRRFRPSPPGGPAAAGVTKPSPPGGVHQGSAVFLRSLYTDRDDHSAIRLRPVFNLIGLMKTEYVRSSFIFVVTNYAGNLSLLFRCVIAGECQVFSASGDSLLSKCCLFRADEFLRSYSTVRSDSEIASKSDSMIRAGSAEGSV